MNRKKITMNIILQKLLKFCSITIIFMSLIRFFFGITFINFYAKAINMHLITKAQQPLFMTAFVITVLSAPLEFVAGIIGASCSEEPSFWYRGLIASSIALVVSVAGMIMQVYIGYGISSVTLICGIIAPAVFVLCSIWATVYFAQTKRKKMEK